MLKPTRGHGFILFFNIHCLIFSSVSWINCPTKCGCSKMRKLSSSTTLRGIRNQPKPLKPNCFLSLQWICCMFPWSLTEDIGWHRYIFASLTVWFKKNKPTMRGYHKGLRPKRVVNWAAEPYILIWFDTYPLACFYLRTPKKNHWPRGGPHLLEQPRPQQFQCRGFPGPTVEVLPPWPFSRCLVHAFTYWIPES